MTAASFGPGAAALLCQDLSRSGVRDPLSRSEFIRVPARKLRVLEEAPVKFFIVLRLNCNHLSQCD